MRELGPSQRRVEPAQDLRERDAHLHLGERRSEAAPDPSAERDPRVGRRWITSADFDRLLVDTVRSTYPAHEHDRFIGHFRGLIGQWVSERGATATLLQ